MALVIKDRLELLTPLGPREVQLLVGDITKLPLEEKVDFVFISAYRNDYTPVHSTLIGCLKKDLGVNVRDLASNKEMDLWKNFSCWVSAPLPESVPYRRVVCFEYNMNVGSIAEQLSQIFRAMVPIFNNTNATVITPLLATGNQGQCPVEVLEGMVNGACQWIKAGLPLHCLKIVLYSRDTSELELNEDHIESMKQFAKLKEKWEAWEYFTEEEGQLFDVLLSFSSEDKEIAEKVKESLEQQSPGIRVFNTVFHFDHSLVWQADIYDMMKRSTKIIVLLTPSYLESIECIEQFNMTLCCNRLKKKEVVMPFYMKTVELFPSYVSMVQYIECRDCTNGELDMALIDAACSYVIKSLDLDTASLDDSFDQSGMEAVKISHKALYDVFISYSHRHKDKPEELVHFLKKNHPDLKVFFDLEELKAGNLWQQALYESIDKAHCVVAFFTPGYVESSVCNEEFNIALARHNANDFIFLFPIHTGALEVIPRSLSSVSCVDLREGHGSVASLAEEVVTVLGKCQEKSHIPEVSNLKQLMAHKRALDFEKRYKLPQDKIIQRAPRKNTDKLKGQVVFSYAQDCLKLAVIMSDFMKRHSPKLVCHLKASGHSERRKHLDLADVIVIFVSDQYVFSQPLVEELHTGLCRQRTEKNSTLIYIIQCNHEAPAPLYFHVLPFSVGMNDDLWQSLASKVDNRDICYHVDVTEMEGTYRCTSAQNFALTTAAYDVIDLLSRRGKGSTVPHNIVNIAKVENEIKGQGNEPVDVHTNIMTLSSVNHLMSQELVSSTSLMLDTDPDLNLASPVPNSSKNKSSSEPGEVIICDTNKHAPVHQVEPQNTRRSQCEGNDNSRGHATEAVPAPREARLTGQHQRSIKQRGIFRVCCIL